MLKTVDSHELLEGLRQFDGTLSAVDDMPIVMPGMHHEKGDGEDPLFYRVVGGVRVGRPVQLILLNQLLIVAELRNSTQHGGRECCLQYYEHHWLDGGAIWDRHDDPTLDQSKRSKKTAARHYLLLRFKGHIPADDLARTTKREQAAASTRSRPYSCNPCGKSLLQL